LKHHEGEHASEKPFSIACSDVDSDKKDVEVLFNALVQARKKTGDTTGGNLQSFTNFVRQKTAQIRKDFGCHSVEYSVEFQDGQVRLKAKPKI
jgi:hypothetical protein